MTEHDVSYLEEIKGFSAYYLSGEAGVSSPTSADTHGARVLTELRDEIVQAWEGGRFDWYNGRDDSDVCHELAAETLTHESYPVFSAWTELCVWVNGWPEGHEPEKPGVYVFTGTIEDMVRDSFHEMLCGYAMTLVGLIREALGGWVCPDCGDTGNPRVCVPGECQADEEEQQASRASQADQADQVPSVGIHPRPATPEPVSDPILAPIAEVESAGKDGESSVTQQFMAYMSAANIAEFAERRRKIRNMRIAAAVLTAVVGVALIVYGVVVAL